MNANKVNVANAEAQKSATRSPSTSGTKSVQKNNASKFATTHSKLSEHPLNKASDRLPVVSLPKTVTAIPKIHNSMERASNNALRLFEQTHHITETGISRRLGTGPNASRTQRKTKYLKTANDVKEKKPTKTIEKKKSKYSDWTPKLDAFDLMSEGVYDGEDNFFDLIPDEQIVNTIERILAQHYQTGWTTETLTPLPNRKLFPRDGTRYINADHGVVYVPYKRKYKIATREDIKFAHVFNKPTGCAEHVMSRLNANVQTFGNEKFTIQDILENLPPGFHIWIRTGENTFDGYCNVANLDLNNVESTKILVIEKTEKDSHVWLANKPKITNYDFEILNTNTNYLGIPNLEPGMDPLAVEKAKPSKNGATHLYYGMGFKTLSAIKNEMTRYILKNKQLYTSLEGKYIAEQLPLSSAAYSLDESRHWAAILLGENPFPDASDNLDYRMMIYRRLTSDYPSPIPYIPTPKTRIRQEDQPVFDWFEKKRYGDGTTYGIKMEKDKELKIALSDKYITFEVPEKDQELWDELEFDCKLRLSVVGLNSEWQGIIMSFAALPSLELYKLIKERTHKRFNFNFQLPCNSLKIPNTNFLGADNRTRKDVHLIHVGKELYGLNSFLTPRGLVVVKDNRKVPLATGHYAPSRYWFRDTTFLEILLWYKNGGNMQNVQKLKSDNAKSRVQKVNLKTIQKVVDEKYMAKLVLLCEDNYHREGDEQALSVWSQEYDGLPNNDIEDRITRLIHTEQESLDVFYGRKESMKLTPSQASEFRKLEENDQNNNNNNNNDNSRNSDGSSGDNEEEEEQEAEKMDDTLHLFSEIKEAATVVVRDEFLEIKKKLSEFIDYINETFNKYVSKNGGKLLGWKAKIQRWFVRIMSFLKSLIKAFDPSDWVKTAFDLWKAWIKFIKDPKPENIPESPKLPCIMCEAKEIDREVTVNNNIHAFCKKCLNQKPPKCECNRFFSGITSVCAKCDDNRADWVLKVSLAERLSDRALGHNIIDELNIAKNPSNQHEVPDKRELTEPITAEEEEVEVEEDNDEEEEEDNDEEEEEEEDEEFENNEPEGEARRRTHRAAVVVEPPTVEVVTAPVAPIEPPAPILPPTPIPPPAAIPAFPTTARYGARIAGYSNWIRQAWDYNSKEIKTLGIIKTIKSIIRDSIEKIDESLGFDLEGEKRTMYWCYRETQRHVANNAERRPSNLHRVTTTVTTPTLVVYDVLFGWGRAKGIFADEVITNITRKQKIVCLEGLDCLQSNHGKIVNNNSSLDVAWASGVNSSNCLVSININSTTAQYTKEFFMIKSFEFLQEGTLNLLTNKNSNNL